MKFLIHNYSLPSDMIAAQMDYCLVLTQNDPICQILGFCFYFCILQSSHSLQYMLCILKVHDELVRAIRDAEEGLFQLKRARLIREADSALKGLQSSDDVKVEPLEPPDVEPEPLSEQTYSIGSKCRFRHTDGRWYNGLIVGMEGSESAKISFLTPTTESMLVG